MPEASLLDRVLRDERGVSMVEFLVVAIVGIVVIGAGMGLMTAARNSQQDSGDRAGSVRDARTGLEKMTRELRQATSVVRTSNTSRLVFSKISNGSTVWVLYQCDAGSCRRAQGASPPSAAAAELVDGLEPAQGPPQPISDPLAVDGCNTSLALAPTPGTYDVFSVSPLTAGRQPQVCVRLRVERGNRSSDRERRESLITGGASLRNAGAGT